MFGWLSYFKTENQLNGCQMFGWLSYFKTENQLNGCQMFGWLSYFKTGSKQIIGFSHTPSGCAAGTRPLADVQLALDP